MTTFARPPAAPPAAPAQRRRRARYRRVPQLPAWSCDNCTLSNAGRRWRCADCGTTRE